MNKRRQDWRTPAAVSRGLVILASLLRVAACTIVDPLPPTAKRFSPPSVYGAWWSMTEACSGTTASFNAIEWYVVPTVQLFRHDGQDVAGYYDSRRHRIVLAQPGQLYGPLVRHEMLHAINGAPGHPRSQFLGRCGGVVVCRCSLSVVNPARMSATSRSGCSQAAKWPPLSCFL